jgi:protein-disulfide isomerase
MRSLTPILALVLALGLLARSAHAQVPACDGLKGPQREVAHQVLASAHPHDGCDGTLAECLRRSPVSPLVVRLAADVCRRAGAGQSRADIERELARRAASAVSPRVDIDVSGAAVAGDKDAPVEVVVYLCARCPYCARLLPQLYASVTHGPLQGKARLIVRPFPIRSHPHSTEGGLAMIAAARLGKSWEFLLHLYAHFDQFDAARLPDCAAAVGLDPERFRREMADPAVKARLVAAKREGIRNHVEATPTVFVARRKYHAELSIAAIEDYVAEVAERSPRKP